MPISKVLLPLLQLPLRLCQLGLLHLSSRPLGDFVKLILVGGFIIDAIGPKIEMGLPQLMLHLDIILVGVSGGGPSAGIRRLVGRPVRRLFRLSLLRVSNREMRLLDLLGNLFI